MSELNIAEIADYFDMDNEVEKCKRYKLEDSKDYLRVGNVTDRRPEREFKSFQRESLLQKNFGLNNLGYFLEY